MNIQPADPRRGYLAHRQEILAAVSRVLDSGNYILGPEVAAFEAEFADYVGAAAAVGVANGTEALTVGLRALGVGQGDTVITVSHTAVATVAAIELAGASPLLVDIDPDRLTMSPASLEAAIVAFRASRHLRAIIPVHLYGQPADMETICSLARQYGLAVLEDCAQAHGASISGTRVGRFGDLGAFSFYPTKNLAAFGDGGAIVSNDPALAMKAHSLREYGWVERYVSDTAGLNSRLDELQAAILRIRLRTLDVENERRREIAQLYRQLLRETSYGLPFEAPEARSVYHQFVIRSSRREELRAFLRENGVNTLIHYPVPVHMQPAYRGRVIESPSGMLATEKACAEILSLPIHPWLPDTDVEIVCQLLVAFERKFA